jgi:hypothetical protein
MREQFVYGDFINTIDIKGEFNIKTNENNITFKRKEKRKL